MNYKNMSIMNTFVKKISVAILMLPLCAFVSCDNIGKAKDNIHLSTKSIDVPAEGGYYEVDTEGSFRWDCVRENGKSISKDVYDGKDNIGVKADWLTAEYKLLDVRMGLKITVEPNRTESSRSCYIGIMSGNYQDRVYINQAGR